MGAFDKIKTRKKPEINGKKCRIIAENLDGNKRGMPGYSFEKLLKRKGK